MNLSFDTTTPRNGAKIISLRELRPLAASPRDESARLQEIGSQAAKIAHDLNNLLTPILMSLEVFQPLPGDSTQKAMLEIARKSTHRAVDLVRQILSAARGLAEERREIDPAALVREIGAFTKATFPRSLKIQVNAPKNLAPILGSGAQLHRALLNLCVNARDAMPDGGTLTIRAANVGFDGSQTDLPRTARGGRYVLFEVSDTGTGIPEAILEKIFDPFFTTKGPGKGTGLGLASVRSIVENHAGLLSVQTEPGKGTTFHILIPASEPEESVLPALNEIRIVAA
ncbi:MAG TPA: ATP-binding protein [Chthoniobacter sp.]|jgi:signal transduction histidine kinase